MEALVPLLIVSALIAWFIFRIAGKKELVCTRCHTIAKPKSAVRGSLGVEILLWLFFIIPGIIYSIWRSSSRYSACSQCGSPELVPVESPRGREILDSRSVRQFVRFQNEQKENDTIEQYYQTLQR